MIFHQNMEILESTANLQFIVIGLIIQYIAKINIRTSEIGILKTSDFWSTWLNLGSSTPSFQIRREKRSCSIVYLIIRTFSKFNEDTDHSPSMKCSVVYFLLFLELSCQKRTLGA